MKKNKLILSIIIIIITTFLLLFKYWQQTQNNENNAFYSLQPQIEDMYYISNNNIQLQLISTLEYGNDIYTLGGDVIVKIDGIEYNLIDALNKGIITPGAVLAKIQDDEYYEKSIKITNQDGSDDGSIVYQYSNYSILHIYNNEQDSYTDWIFGMKDDILKKYKEYNIQ